MSLPATDNFNRADAATLGANWTDGSALAGMGITSNQAQSKAGGGFTVAYWNADVFNNDQYSQAVFPTANDDCFLVVRGSADTFYMVFNPAAGGLSIFLRTPGSFTSLASLGGTIANGDTIKIQVIGTTIKAFQNGVQVGTDTTDATIASGSAGLGGLTSSLSTIDTWEGGNTSGGGGGTNWAPMLSSTWNRLVR